MTSTGSIQFVDRDSRSDGWIGVRVEGDTIGLATSVIANGDIEVFFGKTEAEALRDALAAALELLP